jgi:hypothetical protein
MALQQYKINEKYKITRVKVTEGYKVTENITITFFVVVQSVRGPRTRQSGSRARARTGGAASAVSTTAASATDSTTVRARRTRVPSIVSSTKR